jgi:hypothetical protein
MDQSRQLASNVARHILESKYHETGLTPNSQLLLDLTEMVRQRIRGDKLLGDRNSRLQTTEPLPGRLRPIR